MAIPTFEFLIKDAHLSETGRRFVDCLISTQRFARNERNQIMFLANAAPDDWVPLHRSGDLAAIILESDVIRVTGSHAGERSVADILWFALGDRRWKLKRIGGAWNPDVPQPVRHVPVADRYTRALDSPPAGKVRS